MAPSLYDGESDPSQFQPVFDVISTDLGPSGEGQDFSQVKYLLVISYPSYAIEDHLTRFYDLYFSDEITIWSGAEWSGYPFYDNMIYGQ